MVIVLNNENFEQEILNYDGTCLVDMYADWCEPCQMMAPVVEGLSEELTNVKFGKVNIDDYPELAGNFGVEVIPTLLVIKNGEEIKRFVGITDINEMREALNS